MSALKIAAPRVDYDAATIGSPDVAETPIRTEVDGHMVRCFRHMENVPAPPFYQQSTGITANIDRWQDIEYDVPALYTLHVRVSPVGAPDEEARRRLARVEHQQRPRCSRSWRPPRPRTSRPNEDAGPGARTRRDVE